ncbi:hypothetical protein [Lysinibacillus xylanilyticus]|uniref:hypothetical protein n=1 Tax=Lysinibacillus xylanilyticus TaxID=582475 RepID=UPI003815239B
MSDSLNIKHITLFTYVDVKKYLAKIYKGDVINIGKEEVQLSFNLKCQGSDISSIGEFRYPAMIKLGKWGQSINELDENGLNTSSDSTIFKGTLTEKDKPVFTNSWMIMMRRLT